MKSERFIGYVAMKRPAKLTATSLVAAMRAHFSNIPMMISEAGDDSARPDAGSFIFTVDGKAYTVLTIDQPLPREAWARAVALDRVWPRAADAMAGHSAHLIVAALAEPQSHGDALEAACALSLALSAATTLTDALAVVWSNGDVITEAATFREQALGITRHQLPIDRWISFTWLDGPPTTDGKRTLACLTTGLAPFIGRELEFLPAALPPLTIAQRLIGTCQYLIVNGPVIGDNETLGISESERIRARHAAHGQRPGVPVMMLTVERMG